MLLSGSISVHQPLDRGGQDALGADLLELGDDVERLVGVYDCVDCHEAAVARDVEAQASVTISMPLKLSDCRNSR